MRALAIWGIFPALPVRPPGATFAATLDEVLSSEKLRRGRPRGWEGKRLGALVGVAPLDDGSRRWRWRCEACGRDRFATPQNAGRRRDSERCSRPDCRPKTSLVEAER